MTVRGHHEYRESFNSAEPERHANEVLASMSGGQPRRAKVRLDSEETKHAKELVRVFIGAIVDTAKEQIDAGRPQGASRCRIEYTGSMYEGTKFGRPDEFDIMVVIDGSQDIESEEITPGYARLRAGRPRVTGHRFSKCLHPYQNISPRRMIDWFTGLVQKGVNQVSMEDCGPVSLKVSRHGPAVMVNIRENYDVSIDVDLVLCVQLSYQTYFVAKPYKPYADKPPDRLACHPGMLWRRSFSVIETRTIARIDGANECRRDCLRILKRVFRAEPGLDKFTSFHLKTVLLYMCEDEDQWQSSKVDERFLDLLKSTRYTEVRSIPSKISSAEGSSGVCETDICLTSTCPI
ncbi:hypothetical protein Bbelb_144880 [Branchiostoma belcheri]|nr:hypothetical protein Bbelb_144880 [Branchiostoma belcheri]